MDFNFDTETITPQSSTNLTISATGSVQIPVGTTAQRPGAPSAGQLRHNSDNDVLDGYSSNNSILTSPSLLQRTAIFRKRRFFVDEFMTGTVANIAVNQYGELGWTQTASGTAANSIQTGVVDHLGILRIGTGTTSTNRTSLHLGNTATTTIITANQVEYFSFLFRIPTITTVTVNVGIGQDISLATNGTDGVFFTFNPATNAALQFITRASSTSATAVNTVTIVANTWYLAEAYYNGTTWTPVVNGVTYTAQSGNIPTAAVNIGANVITGTTATRTIDLDYFSMITRELGVRY